MQREFDKIKLKPFKNIYCDAVLSALGKYLYIYDFDENDILNSLMREDIEILIENIVLKNKLAGVELLNIKVPYFWLKSMR